MKYLPGLLASHLVVLLAGCSDRAPPVADVTHVIIPVSTGPGFDASTIAWVKIATLPLVFLTTVAGLFLFYVGARKTGLMVIGAGPVASLCLVFYAEYLGLLIHLVLWAAILSAVGGLIYAIYLHRKGIALSTIAADVKATVVKAGTAIAPSVAADALKLEATAKADLAKLGL